MTDRDIIKAELQNLQKTLEAKADMCIGAGKMKMLSFANACSGALELLKEQEPRVLTLEEVLKANPVWFETHGLLLPAIIDHEESKAGDCVIVFGEFDGSYYPINRYNKTWRCWTAKPTDKQRTEVKWE